ncbi:MAG: N-acetyl sugar amidotransferase [Deltaproteobacteria bacterium]|nr:N-acetyl sugar amidotransferase [Deltaproteobacteria bacterium]
MSPSSYQICTKCIIDTTVAGAWFDSQGVCNHCKTHQKLETTYPFNSLRLQKLIRKMKDRGRTKAYDCVVGISGGKDSIYALYVTKKLGLRPLAVHFNDGFGNPVAGENMQKATSKLQVEMITVSSDWRESKDLRIAFLKASTPDMEIATDIGIETALLGVAHQKNIKYIISGYSFRTEGVFPLSWNYLDGKYLKTVHRQFGTRKLRPWKPDDPGFNLDLSHVFYYTILKRIRIIPLLCYVNYVLKDAETILKQELDWVYPGAKYYDDLYQSLMTHIYRTKFKIDRRKVIYSAQIRSGQLTKSDAVEKLQEEETIEDPKVIQLCIKRLGISQEELTTYVSQPPKTFQDYDTNYRYLRAARLPIWIMSKLKVLPAMVYDKYFN